MWKILFVLLLVGHGLAHISGAVGFWTAGSQAFPDRAWLFSKNITPQSAVGWAFGLVWVAAVLGLAGAGLGLQLGREWWPTLALTAAVISLVAIVPWLRAVPPGAWAGALLDLAILAALLLPWRARIVEALS